MSAAILRFSPGSGKAADAGIYVPAATILTEPGGIRRQSVRPLEHREPNFADKYDDDTVVYDAFWSPSGDRIIMVAPPLRNLLPAIETMTVTALPMRAACRFRIRTMERHAQIRVSAPAGTERLVLETSIGRFEQAVRPNLAQLFAGKRVIFTLSKNNALDWIQDWARYNRDVHGANAILFYDNASTRYDVATLREALTRLSGFDEVEVVRWPFKYGPQGLDARRFWDSDYCQLGAWEHARWLFLAEAASVLNSDIDELVVSHHGRGVFEAVERSWWGVLRFPGYWVPGLDGKTRLPSSAAPIRHRDFDHYRNPEPTRWSLLPRQYRSGGAAKWSLVPRRCPSRAQWAVHGIKRWPAALPITSAFSYRHFREINDSWKYDRTERERFDPARHVRDDLILAHYGQVNWGA